MIIVHHLENSRSQRILWLLEELGVDYTVRRYERNKKTMLAPPELLKVHPLGKSPVITDGNITVAESGAIVEYLVNTHGDKSLLPKAGTEAHRKYIYWLHYAEGSLMPIMVMKLVFGRLPKAPMPFFIKPIVEQIAHKVDSSFLGPRIKENLDFLESELKKSEWFAGGSFSAADVQMSFPVEAAASRSSLIAKYPNLQNYLKRIHARPAYQRALEKGGPYSILGG